jgi:hypothetical protein
MSRIPQQVGNAEIESVPTGSIEPRRDIGIDHCITTVVGTPTRGILKHIADPGGGETAAKPCAGWTKGQAQFRLRQRNAHDLQIRALARASSGVVGGGGPSGRRGQRELQFDAVHFHTSRVLMAIVS